MVSALFHYDPISYKVLDQHCTVDICNPHRFSQAAPDRPEKASELVSSEILEAAEVEFL
jgi:hypothetical protein